MSKKQDHPFDILSYSLCFIGIFLFSTTEIAGKLAGDAISPVVITIVRFLIGALILLPFGMIQCRKKPRKISPSDLLNIIFPGIINVAGAMLFLQFAIYYGKASTSAMLISSNPVFVAIFAAYILKEKLNPTKLTGIFVGLVGVLFIIQGDDPINTTALNPYLGLFFGLLASLSFGFYTVLAKKRIAEYGNIFFNILSFAGGAVVLIVISVLLSLDFTFIITTSTVMLLLYMGIFITGLAYIFFFSGLQKIPTINGSMMFFFKPIIAIGLAVLFLDEKVSYIQLVGVLLIILSIYVTNIKGRI